MVLVLLSACTAPDSADSAYVALDQAGLMDPATCQDCHPDHYDQWQGSMHAYAAVDPIFLAMNARGQRETGGALGSLCVGCHAPMAVKLGETTDGLNLDEVDPAHLGITCYTCHAATEVTADHNNAIGYADDLVLRAGIDDPVDNPAHRSEHGDLQDRTHLDSASMCGTCHDITLPNGLALERTYAEWKTTQYNSDVDGLQQTCGNCHMDGTDGYAADWDGVPVRRLHNHEFPGVDTALTDFPNRDVQEAAVQSHLDPSVLPVLNVCTDTGGTELKLTLENVAAGHAWPSGAAQDRRAWVEVTAWQGDTVVFQSGVVPDDQALSETTDETRWQFGDQMLDDDGDAVHMFWEATQETTSSLPGFTPGVDTHVTTTWNLGSSMPDKVEAHLWFRAFDRDVLQSLIDSGDLDPAWLDAIPTRELANASITWQSLINPCGA